MSPTLPTARAVDPARRGPRTRRGVDGLVQAVGALSARRPWRTLAAWGVLVALVGALAVAFGGAFTNDFSAPGSESAAAMELLHERFPAAAGGSAVAVLVAPEGRRLADDRPAVAAGLAAVGRLAHVASVGDPFAPGHLSPDGRTGYAEIGLDVPAVGFGTAAVAELGDALAPARAAGLTAEVGGDTSFQNAEQADGAEGLGVLAALVVLVVVFGSVVAALVPVVLALLAVGAGLGGIFLLAGALDVSTAAPTIAAMVGLGVGLDYALFIVSRYRDERAAGRAGAPALSAALGSAGTAVTFAGLTVVVAMSALVLTGVGLLATIGLATSLVVLLAVAAALTLLPALLTLLGDRLDAGRVVRRGRPPVPAEQTRWWRLAHRVAARPWPCAVAAALLMLLLAAPVLSLRTGFPDSGDNPTSSPDRRAYDLMAAGFGPGVNAPLVVVADLTSAGLAPGSLPALARGLALDPGVASVGVPQLSPAGDTAVLAVLPRTTHSDPATAATLRRLRTTAPAGVLVTGPTALTLDLDAQLASALPLFVGAVLAASVLLLMVVFRSVVVPLKAAAMNLLSIGAAYGVVVAVFQWGWLGGLLGLDRTYLIASPLPAIFFAVLFGLSMDYEVFLVSRVREAYLETGDTTEAVARGLAATGRVITSGALVMLVVFLSFVTDPSPFVQMIGLGLAVAIGLDATVVRMVLVPATMSLLGRANWWLPAWLDRVLPHLHEGRPAAPAGPAATVPALPLPVA